MISKLYYKIWVDGLTKLRSIPANKGMWKFYAMLFISMAMAINIALIFAILQRNIFHYIFYYLPFVLFEEKNLNSIATFFILYLSLPILINYFLIFRNNRYELLISKYKYYNGKLCITYLIVSYFLPFFLILIGWLLGGSQK